MKTLYIGTNFKMTKGLSDSIAYTKALVSIANEINKNINLFIIPSFPFLTEIRKLTANTAINVGAQNMYFEDSGAFTGEVSPKMLEEIGIDIVELGHSERRTLFKETNYEINKKVKAALKCNLRPLICIGENKQEKDFGIAKEVLAQQLKICLNGVPRNKLNRVLIAYEPVWAIGENGTPANEEYVSFIHDFLKEELYLTLGHVGSNMPLLYGGSVNQSNFEKYINQKSVDGLFIGRAAWEINSFGTILKELNNLYKV